jgi:carbon-monoxide dehydrogenase medium subunit
VAARLDIRDGVIADASVAVGSVNVRPVLAESAAELLRGAEPDSVDAVSVGDAAGAEVEPVADLNGSVDYKRQLVRVLTARALGEVL